MSEGKWIRFTEVEHDHKRKTKQYAVVNKESTTIIGYVKWYGPWRQFAFFPDHNTVYETTCLADIGKFIKQLMLERRLKKQMIT